MKNNDELLSRLSNASIKASKMKEAEARLDYLTRKTYLIKLEINSKVYFLNDDDSLSEKFGGAIKFKKKCDAAKHLAIYLECTGSNDCDNVKAEILIEKDLLRKFILQNTK
ncbi:hypothetical protein CEQ28_005985 [Hafnia alvei]|nr:hypothetical protein CEQ28_005985 [Hafnia alvei]